MKKLLFALLFFPGVSWAGFSACHNGNGVIVEPSSSTAICVHYSDQTTGIVTHDRVKLVWEGILRRYVKWTIEPVEMTQGEKDAVDAVLVIALNLQQRETGKMTVDSPIGQGKLERAVAEIIRREINILRAQHGLADRTLAQLKTQVKSEIDSGNVDQ